jgi:hypothetical protein
MSKRKEATATVDPPVAAVAPPLASDATTPQKRYAWQFHHRQSGEVYDRDMNRWLYGSGAQMTNSEWPVLLDPPAERTALLKMRRLYLTLKLRAEKERFVQRQNELRSADGGSDADIRHLEDMATKFRALAAELADVEQQLDNTPEGIAARQRREAEAAADRFAKQQKREQLDRVMAVSLDSPRRDDGTPIYQHELRQPVSG